MVLVPVVLSVRRVAFFREGTGKAGDLERCRCRVLSREGDTLPLSLDRWWVVATLTLRLLARVVVAVVVDALDTDIRDLPRL